jgi:agmatinase
MTDPEHTHTPTYRDLPELSYAGIPTFMKSDQTDGFDVADDVDVAVAGVPFDGGQGKRAGARFGPSAIRAQTGIYAYYGEYKGELLDVESGRRVEHGDLTIRDCGDVDTVPNDITATRDQVAAAVERMADGAFPVVLGGDHYLTYPSFLGVANALGDDVGVVQLDAHSDTVGDSGLYGKHFNGSPMARIAESPHGDYTTHAMVGIRGYEAGDFDEMAAAEGIHVTDVDEVRERGIEACVRSAIDHVTDRVDHVYVTADIDVVDPGFAPGTGTPMPGGLTSREVLRLTRQLQGVDLVGFDLVEVSPPYDDRGGSTAVLAANVMFEAICALVE